VIEVGERRGMRSGGEEWGRKQTAVARGGRGGTGIV